MKTLISVSFAAVIALSSSAHAGGFGNMFSQPILSPSIGVGVGNINLLNGNALGIANGSSILSGIGNGNGVLNNVGVLTGIGNITNSSVLNGLLSIKKGW